MTVTGCSYALLADGTTAEIRPATPGDLDAVTRFHRDMSPDNLYLRFFSLSKRAAEQEARRVCRPADADHAALLALLGPRLAGLASYELTGTPGLAEIAFAVADDMHGRGIATLLLEHLVSLGRARRVQAFTATTLPVNAPMLRVFADTGLAVRRRLADDVIELTMPRRWARTAPTWTRWRSASSGRTWPASPRCWPRGRSRWWARAGARGPSGGRSCSTSAAPASGARCSR
jgi:GNAT superfamily N-acetyltransferase